MRNGSPCPSRSLASAAALGRLLLLLLLVARAWVPVGYMPDVDALKQGRLALGFCAVGGGSLTALRALGSGHAQAGTRHGEHAQAHHEHAAHEHAAHEHGGQPAESGAGQECPFGLSAHQVLHVPPALALVPALLRWFAQAPLLAESPRPPLPAAGPPLGQRAPPRFPG